MTPQDLLARLDASDAICGAATEGPWHEEVAGIEGDAYCAATGPWYKMPSFDKRLNADAAFIPHARTALPAANAALRRVIELADTMNQQFSCDTYTPMWRGRLLAAIAGDSRAD